MPEAPVWFLSPHQVANNHSLASSGTCLYSAQTDPYIDTHIYTQFLKYVLSNNKLGETGELQFYFLHLQRASLPLKGTLIRNTFT